MLLTFRFNPLIAGSLAIFLFCFSLPLFSMPADSFTRDNALSWLGSNWQIVALVISESLALLPAKPKGILHAITTVLNTLCKKK